MVFQEDRNEPTVFEINHLQEQPHQTTEAVLSQRSADKRPRGGRKKKRRYKLAAPVGMLLIAFAAVGIVAAGFGVTNWIVSLQDDSAERTEIEGVISTVVNLDPLPFESVDKADQNALLNAAIWKTLRSADISKYQVTDDGNMLVPQTDVEVYFKKLFGKNAVIQHQTIQSGVEGSGYVYDEAQKSYLLPPTGLIDSYLPKVEKLQKRGELYYAKVGYVQNTTEWLTDEKGNRILPEADKFMTYVLKKEEGYYIVAIEDYVEE